VMTEKGNSACCVGGILKAIALPTHAAETRGSEHIAHYERKFAH
jgi:hypothetical protein